MPSHVVAIAMRLFTSGLPEPLIVRTIVLDESVMSIRQLMVPRSSRTVVENE